MRTYDTLISLVGENPLPIWFGLVQKTNPNATVVLVCSRGEHGTETVAKSILEQAKNIFPKIKCDIQPLDNPYQPASVQGVLDFLAKKYPVAALNYTGGTKVMSAFAVLSWRHNLENVFYLEETSGLFHFGDGDKEVLGEMKLPIEVLLKLHGLDEVKTTTDIPLSPCELKRIWEKKEYLKFPYLDSREEYNIFKTVVKEKEGETELRTAWNEFVDSLDDENRVKADSNRFPSKSAYEKSDHKKLFGIAKGTWFEQFIAQLVYSLPSSQETFDFLIRPQSPLIPYGELLISQNFYVQRNQFEADIVLFHNNRLRYISVTTSKRSDICKSKMFEAITRSQQIGGGLARSCTISLSNTETAEYCNISLGDMQHKFFGSKDVEKWITGDIQSFVKFLTD